jgi:tellurite resistance protein
VAVFTETFAPVEEAVRLARDAGRDPADGNWRATGGASLDALGALRSVDWARVMADCERSRLAPQLVPVPDLKLNKEDLEAAAHIQRLAQVVRAQGFDAAMVASDQLWGASDAIRLRWPSPMDLRQEVMSAASTQVHAASAPAAALQPTRPDGLEAFVEVALAVARADGVVDASERLSILRGADRLLPGRQDVGAAVQAMLAAKEDSPAVDPARGLARMREALDWSSRLVAFDLLFRVALADGRLAEEERLLLEHCAVGLELPREELSDRLQWFHSTQPAPVPPALVGFRTCPSCSATFEGEANYCGFCGTSMTARR